MVDIFGVESFREYQEGKKLSTNVIIDALQDQGLGARPLKMIAEKINESFANIIPKFLSDQKVAIRDLNVLRVDLENTLKEELAKINPHVGNTFYKLKRIPKGTKEDPFHYLHMTVPAHMSTIRGLMDNGHILYQRTVPTRENPQGKIVPILIPEE